MGTLLHVYKSIQQQHIWLLSKNQVFTFECSEVLAIKLTMTLFSFLPFILLIISSTSNVVASETFYIVMSLNSPCPGGFIGVPCLTLQQYVANPNIGGTTTLLFESGNHTINSPFTASSGLNYNLSGTDAVIQCSSTAKFTFVGIQQVHVSGIRFMRCHNGINFTDIGSVTISDSGVHYSSGASNPPVTISNVSMCSIKHSLFSYNENNNHRRGLIFIVNSNLSVYGSTFDSNYIGRFGGAIHVRDNSYATGMHNITISNSIFINNSALSGNGGVINVCDRSYDICAFLYALKISDSVFVNNTARYKGGAICYYGSEVVVINNSSFINNIANHNFDSTGGALYSISEISITESNFTLNAAVEGGAIYSTSQVSSWNTYFKRNRASNGGGIFIQNVSSFTNCEFFNNTALNFGGGIYSIGTNSSIFITSSIFHSNAVTAQGGGAVYSNGRYSNITILSSNFSSNSAFYCGAIDIDEFYHLNVTIRNSNFLFNIAVDPNLGGGVACIRNSSIEIVGSIFKHSYAALHGGVFYIDESDILVDDSLFVNNSAAMNGGVFYTYVHASHYDIRRSQFSCNSAGNDGGVLFIGRVNSQLIIEDSIFSNNNASDKGGVVDITGSSMIMARTIVFNNTAELGRVISACNSDVSIISGELYITTDPVYSFCRFYDGEITHINISSPTEINNTMATFSGVESDTSSTPASIVIKNTVLASNSISGISVTASSLTSQLGIRSSVPTIQSASSSMSDTSITGSSVRSQLGIRSSVPTIQSAGQVVNTSHVLHPSIQPGATSSFSTRFDKSLNTLPNSFPGEVVSPTKSMEIFSTEIIEVLPTIQISSRPLSSLFLQRSEISHFAFNSMIIDKSSREAIPKPMTGSISQSSSTLSFPTQGTLIKDSDLTLTTKLTSSTIVSSTMTIYNTEDTISFSFDRDTERKINALFAVVGVILFLLMVIIIIFIIAGIKFAKRRLRAVKKQQSYKLEPVKNSQ